MLLKFDGIYKVKRSNSTDINANFIYTKLSECINASKEIKAEHIESVRMKANARK